MSSSGTWHTTAPNSSGRADVHVADEQAAVAAARDPELRRRRDAAVDQRPGDRLEVLVDPWPLLAQAGAMPGRAVLAATADVGQHVHATVDEPRPADHRRVRRDARHLEAAVAGEQRRAGSRRSSPAPRADRRRSTAPACRPHSARSAARSPRRRRRIDAAPDGAARARPPSVNDRTYSVSGVTKSVPTSQTSSRSAPSTALTDSVHTSGSAGERLDRPVPVDRARAASRRTSTLRTSSSTSSTTRWRVQVNPASDAVAVGVNSAVSADGPGEEPVDVRDEQRAGREDVVTVSEVGSRGDEDPPLVEPDRRRRRERRPTTSSPSRRIEVRVVKKSGARSNTWCSNPSIVDTDTPTATSDSSPSNTISASLDRGAASPAADGARIAGSGEAARRRSRS